MHMAYMDFQTIHVLVSCMGRVQDLLLRGGGGGPESKSFLTK